MSPYSPTLSSGFSWPLTALVTKIRLPHTTGLECPRPGIGVFHFTFSRVSAFHRVGAGWPSATPLAFGPRNDGQFPAPDASSCAVTGAKSATRSKMEVECFNIGPLTSAFSSRALPNHVQVVRSRKAALPPVDTGSIRSASQPCKMPSRNRAKPLECASLLSFACALTRKAFLATLETKAAASCRTPKRRLERAERWLALLIAPDGYKPIARPLERYIITPICRHFVTIPFAACPESALKKNRINCAQGRGHRRAK